ncbi:MAG: flagellar basal body L-ring protein FlgH [Pseudomonadota bacterium]
MNKFISSVICVAISALSAGCANFDRLASIGDTPKLTAIKNPVTKPGYKPVSLPMPPLEKPQYSANSLWRNGARAFFKDQRAAKVGDILTVLIEIDDSAEIENGTSRNRTGTDQLGVTGLLGLESTLAKALPGGVNLSELVNVNSTTNTQGEGSVDREESLTTKMAAVVTQRLPNGNLVIEGRQEIRVNFEVREVIVAGIIRPEDISSENTIPISQIAEARVAYGGRGQITDVQQPRYGQQALDVLLPF